MMEDYRHTTIGADYLKTGTYYPPDLLLDYLGGLMKMREECKDNEVWQKKYNNEIEAVKEILKLQTNGQTQAAP